MGGHKSFSTQQGANLEMGTALTNGGYTFKDRKGHCNSSCSCLDALPYECVCRK